MEKKRNWRWIIALMIAALLIWGGRRAYQFVSAPVPAADGALHLPQLPLTPAAMSKAQRKQAVDRARRDAEEAALAAGQSAEQAKQAAQEMEKAADKAFHRPAGAGQ